MNRRDIEGELESFGMKRQAQGFLDFCQDVGGELDMRMANDLACAIGPGEIDYDREYEDQIQGDLTVLSYDPGFPRLTVQHWGDGEHISNTYLENCRIDDEGDLSCPGGLGDLSSFNSRY